MRFAQAHRATTLVGVVIALTSITSAADVPVLHPAANASGTVARFVVPEMRHPAEISEFAWSRDGKLFACGGGPCPYSKLGEKVTDPEFRGRTEEYAVSVFDADAQTLVARCSGHYAHLIGLVFADDGASLATIDGLGVVCRWESRTGKLLWKRAVPDAELPLSESASLLLRFSADGKRLGIATHSEHVVVLDAASGRTVDAYTFGFSTAETFDDQLRLLRVDLDRKIGFADRHERKPDDRQIRRRFSGDDGPLWSTEVEALSPQGAAVVVEQVGAGEFVRLDRPGRDEVTLATHDMHRETTAAFSRDGATGVVYSWEYNGSVYQGFVFNTDDGRITRRFEGPRLHKIGETLTDAGDRVALWNDRTIQLIALPAGEQVAKLHTPHVPKQAALAPNGKLAALADYESLRLWDVDRQSIRWSLRTDGGAIRFAHDSRSLALTAYDGVRMIDVETGKSSHVAFPKLPEQTRVDQILRTKFSSDDRTLLVWRVTRTLGDDGIHQLEQLTIDLGSGTTQTKPLFSKPYELGPMVPSGRGNGMYYDWILSPHAKRLVMWGAQEETAFEQWYEGSWLWDFGIDIGINSGGWQANVRDLKTGRQAWKLRNADDVYAMAIAPDEGLVAFSGHFRSTDEDDDPHVARICRFGDGKKLREIAPPQIDTFVKEFVDERHVVVQHRDSKAEARPKRHYVSVWNATSGAEVVRVECRELLGTAPEQRMLFVRGWDDELALVDLRPYLKAAN